MKSKEFLNSDFCLFVSQQSNKNSISISALPFPTLINLRLIVKRLSFESLLPFHILIFHLFFFFLFSNCILLYAGIYLTDEYLSIYLSTSTQYNISSCINIFMLVARSHSLSLHNLIGLHSNRNCWLPVC